MSVPPSDNVSVQAVRKPPSSAVHPWTTIASDNTRPEVDANTEGYYGEIHFKTGFRRGLSGATRRHRRCAGSTERHRLVGQQLQRKRQPKQPSRPNHTSQRPHPPPDHTDPT